MTRTNTLNCFAIAIIVVLASSALTIAQTVSGELQQWHSVTLTFDGPEASEDGDPNPFTDFRLDVTFVHSETGLSYKIPGYFAADGDAANTSATSGNKWRAHLAPDHLGQWNYTVSFRPPSSADAFPSFFSRKCLR